MKFVMRNGELMAFFFVVVVAGMGFCSVGSKKEREKKREREKKLTRQVGG